DHVEEAFKSNVALVQRSTSKIETIASRKKNAAERTKMIDSVLLHPVFGLLVFFGLMAAIFSSIFWAAAPAMDFIDGTLSSFAERVLAFDPNNLLFQFLANGVIASVAAVAVFLPQIFILFVGIIILEDSGYLARSATLMDRPLSKLGLGGRSFVSLLSGYACSVPAMMAARTINSRKERWLTLFVVPLMSCSARLPVYALLLAFLFHDEPGKAGLALAIIYFASLVVGAIAALIASKMVKFDDRSFFMLELPVYRAPRPKLVIRQALTRTNGYIRRAGPAIFVFALIVWLGTTFPNFREEDSTVRLNSSYAAQIGQVIEPVFEPMGGDWRTGVGLISAFAAREVFVSSLAVVFQVADENEDTMQDTLLSKMTEAKAPNGMPLFTVATVLGLIVFFMIALQCLSTVVVAQREAGSWKFAIMLAVFNIVAYTLAVAIVQGLRAVGIA
ncbi:MAG: ferrous iron transporter B, partial [Bdellovibrionota bacterium]